MKRNNGTIKKPVGIWIRVSTDEQAKGDSPEHHEHRARCYAESKDWEVVEVYHLEGVSGKDVAEHHETRRMMKDVENGRIHALIFSKLARLARNTRQLLDFADHFKAHTADLVSLQESIDTSTPAGRLFYTMIAAMAQWEREEIADRVAASIPIRAKLGKPLGGAAPLGYKWENQKLIPDPKEAPIRRKVHELFREHRRMKTVARLMNEAGHRTRKGGKFSDTTIHRLICDPTAKGLRRANYTSKPNANGQWGIKPEEEWIYSPVEPIISVELWDECKAIYDEQRQGRKKPAKKAVHLFAGVLYCQCGKRMYVPQKSRNYVCAKCRNKVAIDDMEHIFIEQLKGFLLSPEEVESYLEEAHRTAAERENTVEHLQDELKGIQSQIDQLFKLYHEEQIPTEGFSDRYNPLFHRQQELEKEVAEATAALDILKVETLSQDHILLEGQNLADRWPKLNIEEKRRIVEDMVKEIVVSDDEVNISLIYFPATPPLSSLQEAAKGQRNQSGSSRRPT